MYSYIVKAKENIDQRTSPMLCRQTLFSNKLNFYKKLTKIILYLYLIFILLSYFQFIFSYGKQKNNEVEYEMKMNIKWLTIIVFDKFLLKIIF